MSANDIPWDFAEKVPKRQNSKTMKEICVVLPEKIDTEKVTKEKIKNKYVITLPVENDD